MTTARAILHELRNRPAGSQAGQVAVLAADPLLTKLVAVWPSVLLEKDANPDEECPPDTPRTVHARWLWARVQPDPVPQWLSIAGLPDAPHFRRKCETLMLTGMVLPDGGLGVWATQYLQQTAQQVLQPRQPAARPAPAPRQAPPG